ncbi:hypothetical protein GCM10010112_14670 [Actinoplanes lobatus]|uniref:Peptidase C14 caspase domain-containing protein n=1 Tax=Actinoplanes lobatus TaxID=113568 RepID=A0ABQ4A9Y7_9ACTN|nr:caspase family protein [Actinoplanes lobatus]GGN59539.1 hypothetical protein GCM10010112_14670 [Actinoplanes lobatus]GIE37833.1 hypothetical protein Alo02nite_07310 [Actinoplanes lobatus]
MIQLAATTSSRVLLIGIDEYKSLGALPAVRNNLSDLRELLLDEGYWGLPEDRCTVISGTATVQDVGRALRAASSGTGENGLLIIYYAGHGQPDYATPHELRLALYDADSELAEETTLNYSRIKKRTQDSRAGRRLVILDCCFAGLAMDSMNTDRIRPFPAIEQATLMTSVGPTVEAVAKFGEKHTAYTGELLRVLHDGIPDAPEFLDIATIHDAVTNALHAKNRPLPELCEKNQGTTSIALVRNACHPATLSHLEVVRDRQIRDNVASLMEVDFLLERVNGIAGIDDRRRDNFVRFLATKAMHDAGTDEPASAAAILRRHWSPEVADRLGGWLSELMAHDTADQTARDLLTVAMRHHPDRHAAELLLAELLRRRPTATSESLLSALTDLLVRLPGGLYLGQDLYQSLADWPELCLRFLERGMRDAENSDAMSLVNWITQALRDPPGCLRPLRAATDLEYEVDGDDLRSMERACPQGWALLLAIGKARANLDRLLPGIWAWLARTAVAGQLDREVIEDARRAVRDGSNLARLDVLQLLLDAPPPISEQTGGVVDEDYLAGLRDVWSRPELDLDRPGLAGRLVACLPHREPGKTPFAGLVAAADATDGTVRDHAVRAIAVSLNDLPGLADEIRLPDDWMKDLLARPDMGWIEAYRHLGAVCSRRPAAPPEDAAQAVIGAIKARCGDERLTTAVDTWVVSASPEQTVTFLRLLEKVDDTTAARAVARSLLSNPRREGKRIREHLRRQRDWYQRQIDLSRPTRQARPFPARFARPGRPPFAAVALVLAVAALSGAATVWWQSADAVTPQSATQSVKGGFRGALTGHTDAVWAAAFSPDDSLLATGGEDRSVRLWSTVTGRQLGEPLARHRDAIRSIAFSPDGRILATASDDNTVGLWSLQSRTAIHPGLRGHTNAVLDVAFSPDGRRIATGSIDKTVRLWDATTGAQLGPAHSHAGQVYAVAFSPDGGVLASAGSDGVVHEWNSATGAQIGQIRTGHGGAVRSIAFSSDGKRLATGGDDRTIRIVSMADHAATGTVLTGHTDRVRSVAFSPDDSLLASGSYDRSVTIWSLTLPRNPSRRLGEHEKAVFGVTFSADGRAVASCSADTSARLWNAVRPE